MRRSLLLDSLNRDGNRLLTTPRLRYRHEIEMGSRYSDFNVDSALIHFHKAELIQDLSCFLPTFA